MRATEPRKKEQLANMHLCKLDQVVTEHFAPYLRDRNWRG